MGDRSPEPVVKLFAPVMVKPRITVLREIAVAEIHDVVHDRGEAGRLAIGDVRVGRGEGDLTNRFEPDAVMARVEPDQRLARAADGRFRRARRPLVHRIPRGGLEGVLDLAPGMDVMAGGPFISVVPGKVGWSGQICCSGQATHRNSPRTRRGTQQSCGGYSGEIEASSEGIKATIETSTPPIRRQLRTRTDPASCILIQPVSTIEPAATRLYTRLLLTSIRFGPLRCCTPLVAGAADAVGQPEAC